MKSEKEIKKRIQKAQVNKHRAKTRGSDANWLQWRKVEQELKWVLDLEEKPKKKVCCSCGKKLLQINKSGFCARCYHKSPQYLKDRRKWEKKRASKKI